MLAASAFTLVLVAIPLQFLALGTTCTQGADAPFISGSILSGPVLVAALLLALVALRRPVAGQRPWLWASGIAAILLPAITHDAWLNSLFYRTPCGSNFVFYGSDPGVNALIVVAYLALPVVVASLAALGLVRRR